MGALRDGRGRGQGHRGHGHPVVRPVLRRAVGHGARGARGGRARPGRRACSTWSRPARGSSRPAARTTTCARPSTSCSRCPSRRQSGQDLVAAAVAGARAGDERYRVPQRRARRAHRGPVAGQRNRAHPLLGRPVPGRAGARRRAAGKRLAFFCTETRPYLQGARLTAETLAEMGVDTTMITDGMGAAVLSSGKVDALVTAADRVTMDGHVVNKIGTLGLAVAAARVRRAVPRDGAGAGPARADRGGRADRVPRRRRGAEPRRAPRHPRPLPGLRHHPTAVRHHRGHRPRRVRPATSSPTTTEETP